MAVLLALGTLASTQAAVAAPDVIVQFDGLSEEDDEALVGGGWVPSDANLAVGPNHVFEMVNVVGRISSKSGATITSFPLASFFGLVRC